MEQRVAVVTGGVDYSAQGGMSATLANLKTGYELFDNKDETTVDYLLMGPSGGSELESQAKANLPLPQGLIRLERIEQLCWPKEWRAGRPE